MAMRAFGLGALAALGAAPLAAETGPAAAPLLPPQAQAVTLTVDQLLASGNPARLTQPALVPGLLERRQPGSGTAVRSLRGLGDSATIAPLARAVGVFVDGVPIGPLDGSAYALFDTTAVTTRIGSDGARLGRSTSAGAIDIALAAPAAEFGGFVGGGYGSFDTKLAQGSVDVPLGALALKASAYVADDDGDTRNALTGERLNDRDRGGLRLAVRLKATDTLSWTAAAAYTEDKGEQILSFRCNPTDPAACDGRSSTTGLTTARLVGGGPQYGVPIAGSKAGQRLGRREEAWLITSRIGWDTEALSVALVSGLVDARTRTALDFADGRGLPVAGQPAPPVRGFADGGYTVIDDRAYRQSSHELRADGRLGEGLTFAVGAQLIEGEDSLDTAELLTAETGTPTGALQLLGDRILRTEFTHRAAFAQARAAFGPARVEAAIRYTDETDRLSLAEVACGPGPCLGTPADPRLSHSAWLPRVSADVTVADGFGLFASAARGSRPGGWNLRARTPAEFRAHAPELAWTFEGGARAGLLDGRLDLSVTGFALEVDDMQGSDAVVIGGVPRFAAGTLADFRNRGVELQLGLRPLDGLAIAAHLVWQDPQYRATGAVEAQQLACAQGVAGACGTGIVRTDGSLATPVFAPDVTAGLSARWRIPVPVSGIFLTPVVDVAWRSAAELDLANSLPAAGSRLTADGSLLVETDDGNWLLTLSCSNCLGTSDPVAGLLGWAYPESQRRFLLAARRRF